MVVEALPSQPMDAPAVAPPCQQLPVPPWHDDGSFDAFGRLVQRDKIGVFGSQRNYWDGDQLVEKASYNSSTNTETHKKTFVFGPRIDELLLYVDITPNPDLEYYAHADHLGSVMALVDDTGAIAESYRYTEWGVPTILDDSFTRQSAGSSSPVGNPVMYTGQKYAPVASGSGEIWYDYRARHYRADAGRFVQRDPLWQHYKGPASPIASQSPGATRSLEGAGGAVFCDYDKCGKIFCEIALGIATGMPPTGSPCTYITCDCNLPKNPCTGKSNPCGQTFKPDDKNNPFGNSGCFTICIQIDPGSQPVGQCGGFGACTDGHLANVITHELAHTNPTASGCYDGVWETVFNNELAKLARLKGKPVATGTGLAQSGGGGGEPPFNPTFSPQACAAAKAATAAAEQSCINAFVDATVGFPCSDD